MSEFLNSYFKNLQVAAQLKSSMDDKQAGEVRQVVEAIHQAHALKDAKAMKEAELKLNRLQIASGYKNNMMDAGYSSELADKETMKFMGVDDSDPSASSAPAPPVPGGIVGGFHSLAPAPSAMNAGSNATGAMMAPGLGVSLPTTPMPSESEPLTGEWNALARDMEASGAATGVPGGRFSKRQDFIDKINAMRRARGLSPQSVGDEMPFVEKPSVPPPSELKSPDEIEQETYEKTSANAEASYQAAKANYDAVNDPNNEYMKTLNPTRTIAVIKEAATLLDVAQKYWDHVNDKHFQYTQQTASRQQKEREFQQADQTRRDIADQSNATRLEIAGMMAESRKAMAHQTQLSNTLQQLLTGFMAISNHQTNSGFKYQNEVNKVTQHQRELEGFANAVAATIAPGGEPQPLATFDQKTADAGAKFGIRIVVGQEYNMADLNKYIIRPLEQARIRVAKKIDELGNLYNEALDQGTQALDNYFTIINGKSSVTPVPGGAKTKPIGKKSPKKSAPKKNKDGLPPGFHY